MSWHELTRAAIVFVVTQGDLDHELVEGFDASICGPWGLGKAMGWNMPFP